MVGSAGGAQIGTTVAGCCAFTPWFPLLSRSLAAASPPHEPAADHQIDARESCARFVTKKGFGRMLQDTYWCHTVRSITAFRPNRIGECDVYYRTHCRTYYRTYHRVPYTNDTHHCNNTYLARTGMSMGLGTRCPHVLRQWHSASAAA